MTSYLFDLDGTLVSSSAFIEQIYLNSYKQLGVELGGFQENIQYLNSHTLMQYLDFLGIDINLAKELCAAMSLIKLKTFDEYSSLLIPNRELISHLVLNTPNSYIVSNASYQTARAYMDILNIRICESRVFTRERLRQSKPSPEAYIGVLTENRLDPSKVVVYEDSYEGYLSALGAGIQDIVRIVYSGDSECWVSMKWS